MPVRELNILFQHEPSPVELLPIPEATAAGVRLYLKRDELLRMGPRLALSGNKWRKLQYNLQAAQEQGYQKLLTFGGAYSNHIAATAGAGAQFGFDTIGIIRGERVEGLNPTLRFAEACGMKLEFVSRSDYRLRHEEAYQKQLLQSFGPAYLLPEGGTNTLALQGCMKLPQEVDRQLPSPTDYYALSAGTGGTIAGLIMGITGRAQVVGFSALKGNFLKAEVQKWLDSAAPNNDALPPWRIQTNYHFGGYAKHTSELIHFIQEFYQCYGIALDPIYTGKMMYGLIDLIRQGVFPKGSQIVAVHTGGLQGIAGFNERFGEFLKL
jgi:1-aminocyclopropane-1-carboxylate deaminase